MLKQMRNEASEKTIRIGLDYEKSITSLDNSKINVLSEAIILRNLYSSLFDYDEKGNLVLGLADKFSWHGNELHVEISGKSVLSDESNLTAEDVEFSLRRLMFLGNNIHGNLKEIICPTYSPTDADQKCDNLLVVGNNIVFRTISEEARKLLIPLLATVDFRIIPKRAFDLSKAHIPIRDYSVTTGPYYVVSHDESGNFELKANPAHYNYSPEMPQRVKAISGKNKSLVDKFKNGEIDLLPTSIPVTTEDLKSFEESIEDLSIAKTLNLRIRMLFFGKNVLKKTSPSDRFILAKNSWGFIKILSFPMRPPQLNFFKTCPRDI